MKCVITGKEIPQERIEALMILGVPESRWTCIEAASNQKVKGVWTGEAGASELIIANYVGEEGINKQEV